MIIVIVFWGMYVMPLVLAALAASSSKKAMDQATAWSIIGGWERGASVPRYTYLKTSGGPPLPFVTETAVMAVISRARDWALELTQEAKQVREAQAWAEGFARLCDCEEICGECLFAVGSLEEHAALKEVKQRLALEALRVEVDEYFLGEEAEEIWVQAEEAERKRWAEEDRQMRAWLRLKAEWDAEAEEKALRRLEAINAEAEEVLLRLEAEDIWAEMEAAQRTRWAEEDRQQEAFAREVGRDLPEIMAEEEAFAASLAWSEEAEARFQRAEAEDRQAKLALTHMGVKAAWAKANSLKDVMAKLGSEPTPPKRGRVQPDGPMSAWKWRTGSNHHAGRKSQGKERKGRILIRTMKGA